METKNNDIMSAQDFLDWIEQEEEQERMALIEKSKRFGKINFDEIWGMTYEQFMKKIHNPEMSFLLEEIKNDINNRQRNN